MKTYSISINQKQLLISYLGKGSGYSFPHFRNVLMLVNFFLNLETVNAVKTLHLTSELISNEINQKHINSTIENQDFDSYQAAYDFESEMLKGVRNGNVHAIQNQISTSHNMHIGTLSHSSMRQSKNLFICTVTLVTRAAIDGGLNLETAYELSDFYLQKSEGVLSTAAINGLMDTMVLDFTERTLKAKVSSEVPFDIYECLQYIRQHTHSSLSVQNIASHAHLSTSQLVRKFKKSLGFYPSDFIMRCKLEEAKKLLRYTNRSINEISQILCFSSQSYFNNVFKKNNQITPGEYRKSKHLH